jgi:hypothetical protein
MPDSYGKRQRRDAKAKKAAAREERRVARNQRRADRAAGVLEPGPPVGPPEQSEFLATVAEAEAAVDDEE